MNTAWDALVNAGSGVALAALGIWVASLRPQSTPMRALTSFAISFGLILFAWNLRHPLAPHLATWWYNGMILLLGAAASAAMVVIALRLPRSTSPPKGWILLVATGVGALRVAASILGAVTVRWAPDVFGAGMVVATIYFALVVFALRYRQGGQHEMERELVLMSGALLLYAGVVASANLTPDLTVVEIALGFGPHFIIAVVWAANFLAAAPGQRAGPRNLLLLTLAVPVASSLIRIFFGDTFDPIAGGPQWGVSRFLMVAILAYAILRHQLLGIDVKVRWTLSRTTLAGIFIAVFFIASEAAQEFFGQTIGSQYLGILAAGLLVFALAPLSRFADRVAEKALPSAASPNADGERTFREAVRYTLRDGVLSQAEELHLARVAKALGLDGPRATELRYEVQEDMKGR